MANEIDALLQETRTFEPPEDFRKNANAGNAKVYDIQDREAYWANWAEQLDWKKKWDTVLEWKAPYAKWFVGGTLNASYNCLDRHLATRGDQGAGIWEGEPGEVKKFTYRELHAEVCRFANALRKLGVKLGDRVAIYMPLVPEAIVAMLACARIGAVHSVDRARRHGHAPLRHRRDGRDRGEARPRSLVPRPREERIPHVRAGVGRLRADALHTLYIRNDGKAERHHPHDGRLPHRLLRHVQVGLRPQGLRYVLVYGGHRLGHRALVRRLWPARVRRDGVRL